MRKSAYIPAVLLVLLCGVLLGAWRVFGSTNINSGSSDHWAWNDAIGWIDFYNTNTVTLNSTRLQGYASSSVGDISLDCATTRNGNICSAGNGNYHVTNDGMGNLSGWGWNDNFGWISFDCNNNGGCGSSDYRVLVNPNTGEFSNFAWNDLVGWISFNCADLGTCGSIAFRVDSSWFATTTNAFLESAAFDAGKPVQLNSFFWKGPSPQPAGTSVTFQFAASNSPAGPWSWKGTDGTGNTYYPASVLTQTEVNRNHFTNYRYFRYRMVLTSNQAQSASPQVDEVVLNWSP